MQEKRDYFAELMKQTPFIRIPSYGCYFECYSFKNISTESDKEFAIRLVKEYDVTGIPVSAFYKSGKDESLIRFCFAKKESTLEAAANQLKNLNNLSI
jgi:methionine aminotransferase